MCGSKLIGWMLVIGIIVVVASVFVDPGYGGTRAEAVAAIANAPGQASLSWSLGLVGFISIMLGLAYYARRNQNEVQPDVVNIASSLALLSVAVVTAAMFVRGGSSAVGSGITDTSVAAEHHAVLYEVSEALFGAVICLFGLSLLALAVGLLYRQTTLLLKASWAIVALIGLSLAAMSTGMLDGDVEMIVGTIGFVGLPIALIVLGVRTLRSSE
jgi:hypothetical protein